MCFFGEFAPVGVSDFQKLPHLFRGFLGVIPSYRHTHVTSDDFQQLHVDIAAVYELKSNKRTIFQDHFWPCRGLSTGLKSASALAKMWLQCDAWFEPEGFREAFLELQTFELALIESSFGDA